jgi:hypothetical protein
MMMMMMMMMMMTSRVVCTDGEVHVKVGVVCLLSILHPLSIPSHFITKRQQDGLPYSKL